MTPSRLPTAAALLALLAGPAAAQSEKAYAAAIKAYAERELSAWISDPVVLYAIREANETNAALQPADIARLDARWISEEGDGPMIYDLLDRQVSVLMRDRRELSGGVINEIILMDRFGLNVGISDPTSDYYQGDEKKYQLTYLKGPGAIFVDDVEFDESTRKLQAQVSLTITDPETGGVIGAVTFGVNVDLLQN